MSHIDEALKRAKEKASETVPVPLSEEHVDVPVPEASIFSDAWSVGDEGQPGSREPLEDAPAADRAGVPAAADARLAASGAPRVTFAAIHPLRAEKLVSAQAIRPAFVEQYRRLAGTLHHAQLERGIKVVMVTSAAAGEGKTLTATNLALTFSESYRRSVLLIDADLRRPALHDVFQVPNVSGLGEGLRSEETRTLALVEISPRLSLLTAGQPDPDPMSGLTSGRMTELLGEAVARFDWVIIDTPPVGLLPDANLLARMVDATLFVVRAGRTPYHVIQKAVTTIGRDRIVGVVLNGAEDTVDTSYNYDRYSDGRSKADGK